MWIICLSVSIQYLYFVWPSNGWRLMRKDMLHENKKKTTTKQCIDKQEWYNKRRATPASDTNTHTLKKTVQLKRSNGGMSKANRAHEPLPLSIYTNKATTKHSKNNRNFNWCWKPEKNSLDSFVILIVALLRGCVHDIQYEASRSKTKKKKRSTHTRLLENTRHANVLYLIRSYRLDNIHHFISAVRRFSATFYSMRAE